MYSKSRHILLILRLLRLLFHVQRPAIHIIPFYAKSSFTFNMLFIYAPAIVPQQYHHHLALLLLSSPTRICASINIHECPTVVLNTNSLLLFSFLTLSLLEWLA